MPPEIVFSYYEAHGVVVITVFVGFDKILLLAKTENPRQL